MSEASAATITIGARRGVVVLRCSGEVDMTSAVALRDAIDKAFTDDPPALVIDLVDVVFFSSPGISALIAAQGRADAAGVALAVAAASRSVLRPLEVTTVDLILTLRPSVDEALAALVSVRGGW
ncbi:STAS domain-containing protein [Umezawaea sp.]|uniref:STAS domain-containing protein n=1 Tax=Umezawaea sp. TaxID=1955258 RepID=UPI002ED23771